MKPMLAKTVCGDGKVKKNGLITVILYSVIMALKPQYLTGTIFLVRARTNFIILVMNIYGTILTMISAQETNIIQ